MKARGFSLMEILVSMSIIAFISSISVISFSNLRVAQVLDKETATVASVISQARNLTVASKGNNQYGVHLAADSVTLFVGPTYSQSASTNSIFTINNAVSLSQSLTGGSSDILFNHLDGEATQSGTITMSLVSNPTQTKTITVFATGVVQLN
jgi:prepilin-type N-terminal cleavage/methylation domain-containing protein